jgi:hypothetical protein
MTADTLLLRQVHPSFLQNGRPSSQAFRPTPKDKYKLSVYDGDQIEPKACWEHYAVTLQLQSSGVMAVTIAECAAIELAAAPDPESFPEHCQIDFSGLTDGIVEKKAKQLKANATHRDWLFQPDSK